MENMSKEDLLELAKAYEAIILNVAADLQDGEKPERIYYRIYKKMQILSSKYSDEVM